MTMNAKLIASLALGAAFLLGACSGNDAPATVDREEGRERSTGSGETESAELRTANAAYSDAEGAVMAAVTAAQSAATMRNASTRKAAADAIQAARRALDEAVAKAQVTVAAAASPAALGMAQRALNKANSYRTAQTAALDIEQESYAWFSRDLVRFLLANRNFVIPGNRGNVATINRIPRTIPTSPTDSSQKPNPKAFTSATFKDVLYENGKKVFSVLDDDEGGDEFKVDGYVHMLSSSFNLRKTIYTGLKMTSSGLEIRTGGTGPADGTLTLFESDFTDMRRRVNRFANDPDGDLSSSERPLGQNGWDLEIAFDEAQTRPVMNGDTSWTGNGAFFWKSLVKPASSQLNVNGEHYDANAFEQPEGFENLGTYEVWLSNHIGVDTELEPVAGAGVITCPDGSVGTSCPFDDKNRYLIYAAYGLFVFNASTETYRGTGSFSGFNGQVGRINTIHFGYSAFGTTYKTTDIGETITGGRFNGYAIAYEVLGDRQLEQGTATGIETKLLRGDVTLTVNIPRGSGTGTLRGTMNNFQQWDERYQAWTAYADSFMVALNSTAIEENGTFSGTARATPATVLTSSNSVGVYKGSFYGPRSDPNDLEIAGSWTLGKSDLDDAKRDMYGSFGAKQQPAATRTSN